MASNVANIILILSIFFSFLSNLSFLKKKINYPFDYLIFHHF